MSAKMGRPRRYEPDELLKKFQDYMEYVKENEKFANIAGFCLFADIDRETFYYYKKVEEFSNTIKKIEFALEDYTLSDKNMNPTLKIFYMKNKFSDQYKDKIEHDITSNTTFNINLTE